MADKRGMTITIITACYNNADVLDTAMESVLRQSWPEIEYLIVDGGSNDGSVEKIREYEPRFEGRMKWISERDRGMYDALNKGIAMATGEVIGTLNADDVLADDDVIARVAAAMGSSKVLKCGSSKVLQGESAEGQEGKAAVEVIYGDIRFVKDRRGVALEDIREEATVRYYPARRWRPWMLQWGFMPPHPSVYIRRECFERLGVYALDYEIAADYALLVRFLRKARLRASYLPMCFAAMRMGGRSTKGWRSNLLLNREIVRANREAGYRCHLAMMMPKYLFKVWEFVAPRSGATNK